MAKRLTGLRPVYVVGVGWHRYQPLSETPYVELGLKAARQALADAGIPWASIESSYVATALLGMASGRPMLSYLGKNQSSIVHIENASASGSAAFRHACIEVAAGIADTALVLGVDKPYPFVNAAHQTGVKKLSASEVVPFTHFALLTDAYLSDHGANIEDVARVAVKNLANGALNPNAHRQKSRTLEEVLGGRAVSGLLTTLQCCPVGEGAAATIIASEEGIRALGIDANRAVRVAASAGISEVVYPPGVGFDAALTGQVCAMALDEAGLQPSQLDLIELHDAFTIEELHYVEAMGICKPGEAIHLLREGAFDIGGQVAVNSSGGLIAMGHPIGPTGVGQIGEIVQQLRGQAGPRQHKGAATGLAHMVGMGAVAYAHILTRH